jgi:pimeloyl-ACP methyl ester carboxylesterase
MTSLHVDDSGSGDPIVVVHSSGLSGRQWRRLAAELVGLNMRVIAPDLTGHGRSQPWLEPTPFSFTTDVERVLEIVADVGPVDLVGHSYGGLIALHVARTAPRALRSLSVFDPVTFGALDATADHDAHAVLLALDLSWGPGPEHRERWLRTFVDFWGGPGAWDALREDARTEFRRVAWVVYEGVRTLMQDSTPAAAFSTLELPVHLMTGEHSPLPARRVVERLAQTIPGARVTTVPRVGHLGPMTDPDAVNRSIVDGVLVAGRGPKPEVRGPN